MSGYTLQELRDYVRLHLDLDETELPNTLLDAWAREASNRITHARTHWPFYETSWELTTESGTWDYDLTDFGSDVDEVTSAYADNRQLQWIGRDEAEKRFLPNLRGNGQPVYFSLWDSTIRLYPLPSISETLYVRGYRQPSDWVTKGQTAPTTTKPDVPTVLHNTIRNWMVGSAYMQQEDTELGTTFLDLANDELEKFKRRIGAMPSAQPLQFGGGPKYRHPVGRLLYPWE